MFSYEVYFLIQVIILRRINRIPASFQGCWVEQGLWCQISEMVMNLLQ